MATAMPTIFVSHGAPTMALPGESGGALLAQIAALLPRPHAILCASAHWETDQPTVSGAAAPETIHDLYGFPPAPYAMRYAAPGEPALAARVADLFRIAGLGCQVDPIRGLDHGAWIPLHLMYPDAAIPVLQLAIQHHLGPAHHERVGRALAPLLEEGVLILGSGGLTHNLRAAMSAARSAEPPAPPA